MELLSEEGYEHFSGSRNVVPNCIPEGLTLPVKIQACIS